MVSGQKGTDFSVPLVVVTPLSLCFCGGREVRAPREAGGERVRERETEAGRSNEVNAAAIAAPLLLRLRRLAAPAVPPVGGQWEGHTDRGFSAFSGGPIGGSARAAACTRRQRERRRRRASCGRGASSLR
jgi:hypothetical protein